MLSANDREVEARTEFEAIDGGVIIPMNLVFRFGVDDLSVAVEVV